MNKFIVILILSLGAAYTCEAQEDDIIKKNFVFIEFGGPAFIGSINYKRHIIEKEKIELNFRIGIGSTHIKDFQTKVNPDLIFPVGINVLYQITNFKKSNLKAEFELGNSFTSIVFADNQLNPSRMFNTHGYLKTGINWCFNSGLFTGISYSPIFENYNSYRHWGSLTIGYSF